jgi:hypothetical protein
MIRLMTVYSLIVITFNLLDIKEEHLLSEAYCQEREFCKKCPRYQYLSEADQNKHEKKFH